MLKAQFLKTAVHPKDFPDESRPEIALVGRSNSGKSSLLNSFCGRKALARVSQNPGKTRTLNFFEVGDHYRIVDLPGYGYAARAKEERFGWSKMIDEFFKRRNNLLGLVIVCDIRRQWTELEQALVDMASQKELKSLCVLTKKDKLSRSEMLTLSKNWELTSGQGAAFFWPISSLNNDGVRELEDYIFNAWIRPWLKK